MSEHVYKTVEVTGSSPSDLEAAMRGAIAKAAETIRNLDWFELTTVRGHIENGEIAHSRQR
jgi:flavin-binding protein dodecin